MLSSNRLLASELPWPQKLDKSGEFAMGAIWTKETTFLSVSEVRKILTNNYSIPVANACVIFCLLVSDKEGNKTGILGFNTYISICGLKVMQHFLFANEKNGHPYWLFVSSIFEQRLA